MKSSIRPSTLDKNAFDQERKSDGRTAGRLDDPLGSPYAFGGGNEASLREGTARVIMSVSDCDIA